MALGPKIPHTEKAVARFWAKVDVREPDECWLWTAARLAYGYGRFSVGSGLHRLATHAALEYDGKPRPDGMHALHSCDNPPCVNPAHLRWGTNAENRAESISKGRSATGERNGSRKHPDKRPRGENHWAYKRKKENYVGNV